jgi:transposase-like protein
LIEYKIQAVELFLERDKSIVQVRLAYNILHRWIKEYKESNGTSFVGSGHQATKSRNHRFTPPQSRAGGGISDLKKDIKSASPETRSDLRIHFSTSK